MEYLHVLHRLFHEDMGWLTTQYLPIATYTNFLKEAYSGMQTHYSFIIDKTKKEPCIVQYTEIPFYRYQANTPNQGYINISMENSLPELFEYLTQKVGFSIRAIEKIHCKDQDTQLQVELFLQEDFDNLSDIQLCYYYYHEQIVKVRDDIKQHLHLLFFDESKKEKQRKHIVRKYQTKLNYYISVLERKFKEHPNKGLDIRNVDIDRSILDVYKCVCQGLEQTLMYIEECCGQYIDQNRTISYQKRKAFIEDYFDKSQQLIELFKVQKLPKTIEIEVCKPLYAVLDDNLNSMSYIRREYYRKYIDLFTRLLSKMETPNHDQVYKLLIALDYNTHNVYKAMEEEILLRLDQLKTPIARQNLSFRQLHKIQTVAVTSPHKYKPNFPGLKAYLIEFIRKQIDLNQKQLELEELQTRKKQHPDKDTEGMINANFGKRKVNLSVSEIALISRLFKETGVINPQGNKQHYFKFISKIYTSKDADNISEKSIKNCFYTISSDTFETVERLLIRILNKLQMLRDSKAV